MESTVTQCRLDTFTKTRRGEKSTSTYALILIFNLHYLGCDGTVCHLKSSEEQVTAVATLSQKLVRDYVRKLAASSNILKLRRAKKDKLQDMVETASLCGRNRRSLEKREQLRFDHVEKDKGFHKNEGKSVSSKAVSEAEGLQNIIHEHFNVLEKQYREGKKIRHLLHAESCVISEEWKSFQIVNLEICMEIGDSITDDIVSEIIDLF